MGMKTGSTRQIGMSNLIFREEAKRSFNWSIRNGKYVNDWYIREEETILKEHLDQMEKKQSKFDI